MDKVVSEEEVPVSLCNYVDVYLNDAITPDMPFMSATATLEEIRKFSLRYGDVLITKDSESWKDIAVPAFVTADLWRVLCGYHLAQVRPIEGVSDGRYLAWCFSAREINYQFQVAATGITRYGLSIDSIANGCFPLPPYSEQQYIANFLDRETARIDAIIEKKQRQIELLEEKRIAVISHVVTKGLNPNVKMKDSGVEWLGEIPEHWGIVRLAMAASQITNGYVGPTRGIFVEEGVRYIQSLHIKGGRIVFERGPYYVTKQWSQEHAKSQLRKGDVLVVQTGDIGQVCVVDEEFAGSNCHALMIIRLKEQVAIGSYVARVLESNYGQSLLKSMQTGALHPHLECGKVRDGVIPIPPVEEQHAIVHELQRITDLLGSLTDAINGSIGLLKEYRSSLISAAVTGQIAVRGEVTPHDKGS